MYAENGGIKPDKYDQIYHQVKSEIPTDGFYIAVHNARPGELDFKCINDEGIPYTEGPKDVFKKDWRLRKVMKEKKAQKFTIDPCLLEEKRPRDHRVGNLEKASPSILIAPILQLGGELIGVISAQSYKPNVYVPEHLNKLFIIASHIAGVIRFQETLMVGESRQMQRLYSLIKRVASSDVKVLIGGETGTGKELIAQAIHNLSSRKEQPFIPFNCSTGSEHLFDSELFGYQKGAFTGAKRHKQGRFEVANGGTLFLDEVGDLPLLAQPKLLRAIEDKEIWLLGETRPTPVDVRIIAATNRNLEEATKKGQFREDLFYRLNVFPIEAPPLREHKDDLRQLIPHILKLKGSDLEISDSALQVLIDYDYPGNVRELDSIIERAVISTSDGIILPEVIHTSTGGDAPQNLIKDERWTGLTLPESRSLLDEIYLKQVLQQTEGNISQAAKKAGINRKTLSEKAKKHNIDYKSFKH